ncbi:MAG: hypothetical protein LBC92_03290 [Rickettsiales bacterium]|jgi:hypothetical protein|nr:hypothetical protein [Rickettsiales bacterium]
MVDVSKVWGKKYKDIAMIFDTLISNYSFRGVASYKNNFFSPDVLKFGDYTFKIKSDVVCREGGGKNAVVSHDNLKYCKEEARKYAERSYDYNKTPHFRNGRVNQKRHGSDYYYTQYLAEQCWRNEITSDLIECIMEDNCKVLEKFLAEDKSKFDEKTNKFKKDETNIVKSYPDIDEMFLKYDNYYKDITQKHFNIEHLFSGGYGSSENGKRCVELLRKFNSRWGDLDYHSKDNRDYRQLVKENCLKKEESIENKEPCNSETVKSVRTESTELKKETTNGGQRLLTQ